MKKFLIILLIFILMISPVIADDDGEIEDEEDEINEEFAEFSGSLAITLLLIGSGYVLLRRLYSWSRSWKEQDELKSTIMSVYRQFRKPLLIVHNWFMGLSVVVGGIHGIFLLGEDQSDIISGTVAWFTMLLLSIFGIIMFFRMRPIWKNRKAKGFVRFIHRQWYLSIFLIIVLIIHIA